MAQSVALLELLRNLSVASNDPIENVNTDRSSMIEKHLKLIESFRQRDSSSKIMVRFMAPNRSFPIIPLDKSNVISIDDILKAGPNFAHEGKLFLCRSILPEARSKGPVTLLVDDPIGQHCLRVSLFNFSGFIRPGTILAIMHPWFNVSRESAGIKVENPQHVRILTQNHPLVGDFVWKTPLPKESEVAEDKCNDDLAREGNIYLVDKNYHQAVEAYSKAIKAHPKIPILYSNRALAYLKMEKPEEALQDTEMGLKLEPSNVKLLYRKGKALIQLKRYEEAALFLEKARKEHKEAMKDKTFAELVKVSKRMVEEWKTANYDVVAMIDEAKRSKLVGDNHADYYATGKFEIKEIPGKGRGLVAKTAIKAGTLLMACKAFVFAEVSEEYATVVDLSTMTEEASTFAPMVQKACEKMLHNPNLGDDFYKLYAGDKLGWLDKADRLNPVDIDRIAGIISLNAFSGFDLLSECTNVAKLPSADGGIWIQLSYINHACVGSNCIYYSIGDFLFLRAVKNIDPGEELLVGYRSPWDCTYEERRLSLQKSFGFQCSCTLCQVDQNDSEQIRKRLDEIAGAVKKIRERYFEQGSFKSMDVAYLKKLLEESIQYRPNMEFNIVADMIRKVLATAFGCSSPFNSTKLYLYEEIFATRKRAGDMRSALIYAKILVGASAFKGVQESFKWITEEKKLAKFLYGDERLAFMIEMN